MTISEFAHVMPPIGYRPAPKCSVCGKSQDGGYWVKVGGKSYCKECWRERDARPVDLLGGDQNGS